MQKTEGAVPELTGEQRRYLQYSTVLESIEGTKKLPERVKKRLIALLDREMPSLLLTVSLFSHFGPLRKNLRIDLVGQKKDFIRRDLEQSIGHLKKALEYSLFESYTQKFYSAISTLEEFLTIRKNHADRLNQIINSGYRVVGKIPKKVTDLKGFTDLMIQVSDILNTAIRSEDTTREYAKGVFSLTAMVITKAAGGYNGFPTLTDAQVKARVLKSDTRNLFSPKHKNSR